MAMSTDTKHVQMLAYQLWEQEGRPAGRDKHHWLEAERRLTVQFQPEDPPPPIASSAPRVRRITRSRKR